MIKFRSPFASIIISALCWLVLSLCVVVSAQQPLDEFVVAYVGDNKSSAFLGVQQGLAEANIQGQFLGQRHKFVWIESEKRQAAVSAVLVASDAKSLREQSEQNPTLPVFNLTMENDELREACLPNVLHMIPSARMKHDAVTQWHVKHPNARASAVAWHPSLKKYAGEQLNKRFKEVQGRPMDDYSWAGWAAVRMIADTAARIQTNDPKRMLDFLRTELKFDGQKGTEMSFRQTGQLRQILLIVEADKIVGEAPVHGVVDPQDLDSLGPSECSK
ncbi:MAG: ABC transporter substrate-binding protein [Gammaproteobacteria bacterium]